MDTKKKKWWYRFIARDVTKSMWESEEAAQVAIDSALAYGEKPPRHYQIKPCVVTILDETEEVH